MPKKEPILFLDLALGPFSRVLPPEIRLQGMFVGAKAQELLFRGTSIHQRSHQRRDIGMKQRYGWVPLLPEHGISLPKNRCRLSKRLLPL
jgi:hypothetical protein